MAVKVKGFAFVLNNKTFPKHPVEKSRIRNGSEVDLANMTRLWEQIGYKVFKHENLTGQVRDIDLYDRFTAYFSLISYHWMVME